MAPLFPRNSPRWDGKRWESGTEWEFTDAASGYEEQLRAVGEDRARPHLLAYKKTARRLVEEDESKEREAREQAEKLRQFENEFFFHEDGTAKRARFLFETLDEFESLFEPHLEELVRRELTAFANLDGDIPIVPVSGSPFKGLRSFDIEDAPLFFGRFRAIQEVLEQLRTQKAQGHAFVMVYGSSGFGKSSLMRAGVGSRLTEPGFIPNADSWRYATLYPARGDGELCEALSRAIFSPECLPELGSVAWPAPGDAATEGNWDVARLARALETRAESCFDALTRANDLAASKDCVLPDEMSRSPEGHLCLLLDQFEEVFTREDIGDEERERFFHALGILSTHPRVWILATMRSEYFPRLADHDVLKSLTEKTGGYLLTRPELTELNQMIRYPALAAGLGFETDRETNESLSSRLYQDMTSDPGALPLLQFCLEELYERREQDPEPRLTWKAYREIGGLRGSIATVADQTWNSLTDSARSARDTIFSELVTVGDRRSLAVRKRCRLSFSGEFEPGGKGISRHVYCRKTSRQLGPSRPRREFVSPSRRYRDPRSRGPDHPLADPRRLDRGTPPSPAIPEEPDRTNDAVGRTQQGSAFAAQRGPFAAGHGGGELRFLSIHRGRK